jgi:hypothetical protein
VLISGKKLVVLIIDDKLMTAENRGAVVGTKLADGNQRDVQVGVDEGSGGLRRQSGR